MQAIFVINEPQERSRANFIIDPFMTETWLTLLALIVVFKVSFMYITRTLAASRYYHRLLVVGDRCERPLAHRHGNNATLNKPLGPVSTFLSPVVSIALAALGEQDDYERPRFLSTTLLLLPWVLLTPIISQLYCGQMFSAILVEQAVKMPFGTLDEARSAHFFCTITE